jgi:2-polyprenyl-6-methoxyphenol hydroxylase-like FAD-dependent oxidoreductase
MEHSSFLDQLAGQEYGRLWAWGNKPAQKGDYEMASPCHMSDLPQSLLEPILVQEAQKAGAEFRFYTEFVSLEQQLANNENDNDSGSGRVRTVIRDRTTGQETTLTSAYVVGCDGARSPVLNALGIPITGRQLNTAFNVHIRADLGRYIAHRPGSLNWVLNPSAPDWSAVGNFRMVRPWTEWVVSMHPARRDGATSAAPTEADIVRRLHQMIGDETVPIQILSAFQWTINDQVASTWQSGRVLCIGDAAHRHPPINGLGSNTCISDAFNLAWKLAYVVRGVAHARLLETLTPERKPVGDGIVRRANDGMEAHRRMWSVIGLDQESRQKALVRLTEDSPAGRAMREEWSAAMDALDAEVQALGIQMNQVYTGSPAVLAEPGDEAPDFSALDPLRQVMVSTFPGYHLPHVWLARDAHSPRVSTLDLAGQGRFTLFTGIGGGCWLTAAQKVSQMGLDIARYTVGFGCEYLDCYREWERVRGVQEDGVVLVRPDHFVGWRCNARKDPDEAYKTLERVIRAILMCIPDGS